MNQDSNEPSNQESMPTSGPVFFWKLISLFFVLAIAANFCSPEIDFQSWRHLSAGHSIVEAKALPKIDSSSAIGQGQSWVNDSWLFDLSLAGIEGKLGEASLLIYKFFLFICFSGLCFLGFLARSQSLFFAGITSLVVSAGCLNKLGLSTVLVGLICLAALSVCSRLKSEKASFFLGFLVLVLAVNSTPWHLLCLVCLPFLYSKKTAFLLSLSVFCSPYLGLQSLQSLEWLLNSAVGYTGFAQNGASIYHFDFVFLILFAAVGALLALNRKAALGDKLSTDLGLLLVLLLMSLAWRGFTPWALFWCAWIVSSLLCDLGGCEKGSEGGYSSQGIGGAFLLLREKASGLSPVAAAFFCFALTFQQARPIFQARSHAIGMPIKEVDLLINQAYSGASMNELPLIWHSEQVGDYLSYRLSALGGDSKPLWDSRLALFAPEVFTHLRASEAAMVFSLGKESVLKHAGLDGEVAYALCNTFNMGCVGYLGSKGWTPVPLEAKSDTANASSDDKGSPIPRGWVLLKRSLI